MFPKSFAWPLTPLSDHLWTSSTPIRFAGVWFPHVMTVVRLYDGSLLLHSPCRPSPSLLEDLEALGTVKHIIAPNWFHDLYLAEYRKTYPLATFWGPKFLQRLKGRRLIDATLGKRTPWEESMPHYSVHGLLTFNETLFFHRPSSTLIVADLLMNVDIPADAPPSTRFVFKISRVANGLSVFPYLRLAVTDWRALRDAAEQMAMWKPQNIVVAHGRPITKNATAQLSRATKWLIASK